MNIYLLQIAHPGEDVYCTDGAFSTLEGAKASAKELQDRWDPREGSWSSWREGRAGARIWTAEHARLSLRIMEMDVQG